MVTEQQLEVIRRMAAQEIHPLAPEPQTIYERGAVKRFVAYGIRVLEATQPDSWEMPAVQPEPWRDDYAEREMEAKYA